MSCRHDLACGTCKRCYPSTGTIEPAPESEYEDNLEGLGVITKEEHAKSSAPKKEEPPLKPKPLVMIESPYRHGDRNTNLRFLAWCEFDSYMRGEHPISSHGNCTAYLPEDEESRVEGFAWREKVVSVCESVAYYTNLGLSDGMNLAMANDRKNGRKVKRRQLGPQLMWHYDRGEHAPGSMRRGTAPVASSAVMDFLGVISNRSVKLSNGWDRYAVCDKAGPIGTILFHKDSSPKDILVNLVQHRFGDYVPMLLNHDVVKTGEEFDVVCDGVTSLMLHKVSRGDLS